MKIQDKCLLADDCEGCLVKLFFSAKLCELINDKYQEWLEDEDNAGQEVDSYEGLSGGTR